jgi:hypothetical protein
MTGIDLYLIVAAIFAVQFPFFVGPALQKFSYMVKTEKIKRDKAEPRGASEVDTI